MLGTGEVLPGGRKRKYKAEIFWGKRRTEADKILDWTSEAWGSSPGSAPGDTQVGS